PYRDEPVSPATVPAVGATKPEPPARKSSWFDRVKKPFKSVAKKATDAVAKTRDLFDTIGDIWDEVTNIPGWVRQGHLDEKKRKELENLARARPSLAWPVNGDIADARNAHRTNTFAEMRDALKGEYDWLECDVRLEGPLRDHVGVPLGDRRPITAHDSFQTNGLLFEDWVKIAKESGRGIKVDFKDSKALDQVLTLLKNAGVPDHRLILNIGIPDPKPGETDLTKPVSDERLQKIRAAFPQALINLSPGGGTVDGQYSEAQIAQMIRYAKAAGQPVMFPLRAEWVTREVVQKLEPHGKVAIWNSPNTFNPADPAAEIARFRSWGVTGMIDLMTTH
ncbi:MAG TPA: DUF2181 domain-containing protein, partial [Candidatus Ozemobacteraceae bacterium]|nr:DUF2181 domain-containing protein [Candidatus Ozemobacteraceae bacterium]